jgi:Ca-activated chloride channel homolog
MDWIAFLIAVPFLGVLSFMSLWGRRFPEPQLRFSWLSQMQLEHKNWKEKLVNLPKILMWVTLFLWILAFLDPHLFFEKKQDFPSAPPSKEPTEGIAIYLVLDQSGSMADEVDSQNLEGQRVHLSKEALLKDVTKEFVKGNPKFGLKGRPHDLMGLVTFARTAQVLSPLTLDHQTILDELAKLKIEQNPDLDGTAIGYAIYKTVNLIAATRHFAQDLNKQGKSAYEIKNSIIVLVTDGFQSINPLDQNNSLRSIDLPDAAKFAKENHVRLYIINVEPKMASEEFGPQRRLMQRIVKETGGEFYLVDSSQNLAQIYQSIDRLEKSSLPVMETIKTKAQQPEAYRRFSFYPFLILSGLITLFLSLLLETTWLRRVP